MKKGRIFTPLVPVIVLFSAIALFEEYTRAHRDKEMLILIENLSSMLKTDSLDWDSVEPLLQKADFDISVISADQGVMLLSAHTGYRAFLDFSGYRVIMTIECDNQVYKMYSLTYRIVPELI